MKTDSNYYVYAYFDPRNYEMLYVGKGQGSRKNAHVPNKLGSDKERQLHEIQRAGLEPLIRVVVARLSEDQAYLVEKALIWKSGKSLKNINSGRYKDNFRPPDTLHLSLPGFDTARGIFFVNVGDWEHRLWEDSYKFGFLAAGHGTKYSSQLNRLSVGDLVAAYLSGSGYGGQPLDSPENAAVPVKAIWGELQEASGWQVTPSLFPRWLYAHFNSSAKRSAIQSAQFVLGSSVPPA